MNRPPLLSLPPEALRGRIVDIIRKHWQTPRLVESPQPVAPSQIEAVSRQVLDAMLTRQFRVGPLPHPEVYARLLKRVRGCVRRNEPVAVTIGYGPLKNQHAVSYSRADWAEFFALCHLVAWHNKVQAVYAPGLRIKICFDDSTLLMANRADRTLMDSYMKSMPALIQALGYEAIIIKCFGQSGFSWSFHFGLYPLARLRVWWWERNPAHRVQMDKMDEYARRNVMVPPELGPGAQERYLRRASHRYRVYWDALQLSRVFWGPFKLIAMYLDGTQHHQPQAVALHLTTLDKGQVTQPWQGEGALVDNGHSKLEPFVLTAGRQFHYLTREVDGLDLLAAPALTAFEWLSPRLRQTLSTPRCLRFPRTPSPQITTEAGGKRKSPRERREAWRIPEGGHPMQADGPDTSRFLLGGLSSPASESHRRLKILLTEGSSLSARQTLYALGRLGHALDVCDPGPLTCLCRYSRYVRFCYPCPSFVTDPVAYVAFLLGRLHAEHYDVLFPTHDQAFLLARVPARFRAKVGLAVPDFAAMLRVQSKAAFVALLDELKLPHPPTTLVRSRTELERAAIFPCYIKLPYATAGCGVWHIASSDDLRQTAERLEKAGLLNGRDDVLVQQPAAGVLCVVQSVFCHGRLVAAHCYQARALGVGGSARARVGVSHPLVVEHLGRLGKRLGWHGALMLDYLYDETAGRPAYIDANPRIGETVNAMLSGVNLCELLVQISLGKSPPAAPAPRPGVRTHALTMSLLAKAEKGAGRLRLLGELYQAWSRKGFYAASEDELTRPHEDWLSVLPAAFVALRLLAQPRTAKEMVAATVRNYALSEQGVQRILRLDNGH